MELGCGCCVRGKVNATRRRAYQDSSEEEIPNSITNGVLHVGSEVVERDGRQAEHGSPYDIDQKVTESMNGVYRA